MPYSSLHFTITNKMAKNIIFHRNDIYKARVPPCSCILVRFSVHVRRYFGSAEGSKFVEMASVDNVKRTWVNYGGAREWSDPMQGQVGGGEGVVTVHEKSKQWTG